MKRLNGRNKPISPEVLNAVLNGADTRLHVSDLQADGILFINDK